MCVNWNQQNEQKKQKNCDRANKNINKRKGSLVTNKQKWSLIILNLVALRQGFNE